MCGFFTLGNWVISQCFSIYLVSIPINILEIIEIYTITMMKVYLLRPHIGTKPTYLINKFIYATFGNCVSVYNMARSFALLIARCDLGTRSLNSRC